MSLLQATRSHYRRWLFDHALPLWWEIGADHVGGGFHESIDQSGRAQSAFRRSRVQTRQIYVYATAGRMGWDGPWREAVGHGLNFFFEHFLRSDGLTRAAVTNDGVPLHDDPVLYDQAFALLAMASAQSAGVQSLDLTYFARELLGRVLALTRHDRGGFREPGPGLPEWQSNAHMHLLEAVLAWSALDEDPRWNQVADEIVELALGRFIDRGRLKEYFDENWTPSAGVEGRLVEPGHQFEWAWLLYQWGRARSRDDAVVVAARLIEAGRCGIDPSRNIAVQQLLDDNTVHDPVARLWPQTEWLKAAAISAEQPGVDVSFWESETVRASSGLARYLEVPVPGLWRERSYPDGRWSDEPAPASSFYHIICGLEVLRV